MSGSEPGPAVQSLIELAGQVHVSAYRRTNASGKTVDVRSYMRSVSNMSNSELNKARETLYYQPGAPERNQLQRVMGEMRKRGLSRTLPSSDAQRAKVKSAMAQGEKDRKTKRILAEIKAQKSGGSATDVPKSPEDIRQAEFKARMQGGTTKEQDLQMGTQNSTLHPKPSAHPNPRVKELLAKLNIERVRPAGGGGRSLQVLPTLAPEQKLSGVTPTRDKATKPRDRSGREQKPGEGSHDAAKYRLLLRAKAKRSLTADEKAWMIAYRAGGRK